MADYIEQVKKEGILFELRKGNPTRYFVYDINKMTIKQKLDARRYFVDNEESKTLFPETPDQLKRLNIMEMEHRAYALILTEVDEKGERVYPYKSSDGYSAMDYIESIVPHADFIRLEKCRENFFTLLGIEQKLVADDLVTLVSDWQQKGGNQEGLQAIIQAVLASKGEETTDAMKSVFESFTKMEAKAKGSEKSTTPASSG